MAHPKPNPVWPVLKTYDENHLARIALPLGGIWVDCSGRGVRHGCVLIAYRRFPWRGG